MANWRPVDVRVWNDRKFLAGGDDARLLWLYLLTCPSLPIPGVVLGGDGALAEMLGWTPERLRERFQELSRNGLRVAREGRIVWLRNALNYQPPSNPNMVKGWAKLWDNVPEGELKLELWEALRIACKPWSVLFGKLFKKPELRGIGNGSGNGSADRSPHDHKHDHDHDHQHDPEKSSLAGAPAIQPPRAPETQPPPYDQNDQFVRGRLAESTYRRISDARLAMAAELGLPGQLPFPPITPSSRPRAITELLDRIREEADAAPAACDLVVANLIAQARDDRSVEWLSQKSFSSGAWTTARERIPGRLMNRARAGPQRDVRVGQIQPGLTSDYPDVPDGEMPL